MTTEATVTLPVSPADYVKHNGGCPHCTSEAVSHGDINITGSECAQEAFCLDCGAEWEDVYTMTGYRATKAPD